MDNTTENNQIDMDETISNEVQINNDFSNGECAAKVGQANGGSPAEIEHQKDHVTNSELKVTAVGNMKSETSTAIITEPQMSYESIAEAQTESVNISKSLDSEFNDDSKDVDLSAVEVAKSVIDQTLTIDDTDILPTDKNSEVYEIMNVCSTTAQEIKKTISEVLNSRENIVTADDSTSELEFSLSKKIADFENVVSGCLTSKNEKNVTDSLSSKKPELNVCEIVEITEVCEETDLSEKTNSSTCTNDVPTESSKDIIDTVTNTDVGTNILDANTNVAADINLEKNTTVKTDLEKPQVVDEMKEKSASHIQPKSDQKDAIKLPALEDEKSIKKPQKSYVNRKKGEKTVDQVLKSLSNYSTIEEKLQVICKRHVETLEELRLLEPRMKQLERQVISQQREKEQLQAEHNRMILAKSRLESLCRELQRQSKAMKEESLLRIREEEEKRKEVANKFQITLNDISTLMQENSKKNIQLREENSELAKKLKALVDHYEMWEKHMEKVVQQKDLEAQLAKAKHAKINLLLKQETEKFLREKQSLLENMSELQKKCTMLTSNELQLRTELGDYTSKYEEFQSVLNKSSQVFASFKNDMDATSKKIKKLEKETNVYKQKWESSNNALLGMINDKQKHDKELTNAQQRILTLEKLCRALQAERNELQNQLNTVSSSGAVDYAEKDVPSQSVETEVA